MFKFLSAYLTTIVVMFVLEIVWPNMAAKPIYQEDIGHLMASEPNLISAGLFYLVYAFGLMRFSVIPNSEVLGFNNVEG